MDAGHQSAGYKIEKPWAVGEVLLTWDRANGGPNANLYIQRSPIRTETGVVENLLLDFSNEYLPGVDFETKIVYPKEYGSQYYMDAFSFMTGSMQLEGIEVKERLEMTFTVMVPVDDKNLVADSAASILSSLRIGHKKVQLSIGLGFGMQHLLKGICQVVTQDSDGDNLRFCSSLSTIRLVNKSL